MKTTKKHAFTLIELIVVIIIIGILASVAVPSYSSYIENSKERSNQRLEQDINNIIETYYLTYSSYPNNDGYSQIDNDAINNDPGNYLMRIIMQNLKTVPVNAFCNTNRVFNADWKISELVGKTWQELINDGRITGYHLNDGGIEQIIENDQTIAVRITSSTAASYCN